ncbi:hypothetical protein [Nocardioides sp.]|uniref:hypothetical protein n=1 Tax=Nocardioides sp. TaxID=35761 RepID=UPI0035695C74
MGERASRIRDSVVGVLAKISLVLVLGLLGAFFVGTSAQSHAMSANASTAPADVQTARPSMLSGVRPIGLVVGVIVLGSGVGVLLVGAFKPEARRRHGYDQS